MKAYLKKWREANREKIEVSGRLRAKAWRKANPDKASKKDALWRKNNPDKEIRKNAKKILRRWGVEPDKEQIYLKCIHLKNISNLKSYEKANR